PVAALPAISATAVTCRGIEVLGWKQRDVRLRGRPNATYRPETPRSPWRQLRQMSELESAKADFPSSPGEDFSPTPNAAGPGPTGMHSRRLALCLADTKASDPEIARQPGNESVAAAQQVPVPGIVSGALWNGKASSPAPSHYYRFAAKQG